MKPSICRIFGVPMDLGQSRRGVDMGPSALRYAGLQERITQLGYQTHDGGNIIVPQVEEMENPFITTDDGGRARYLPQVIEACQNIYERGAECDFRQERVIFLGGDHSMSIGTISAACANGETIGVVWVDTHGDINTPQSSPSGNIHGMPVSILLGDGPKGLIDIGGEDTILTADQFAMIGIRDLDPPEQVRLRDEGMMVCTMRHIDENGIASSARSVLEHLAQYDRIHVSLDMDALDPTVAPGVGTPYPGGLSYREAHLLMEILGDSGKVHSMDIVEVNPILDDRNKTAEVAVELAASLFGQRII